MKITPFLAWGDLACRVLSDRESGNTKTVQKNGKSVGHQATLLSDACDVKNEAEKVTGSFRLQGTKSGKKAQTRWGVLYGTHSFACLGVDACGSACHYIPPSTRYLTWTT